MSLRLHSNATYEYRERETIDFECEPLRGRGLYACVYVGVACVYNCRYTRALRNGCTMRRRLMSMRYATVSMRYMRYATVSMPTDPACVSIVLQSFRVYQT